MYHLDRPRYWDVFIQMKTEITLHVVENKVTFSFLTSNISQKPDIVSVHFLNSWWRFLCCVSQSLNEPRILIYSSAVYKVCLYKNIKPCQSKWWNYPNKHMFCTASPQTSDPSPFLSHKLVCWQHPVSQIRGITWDLALSFLFVNGWCQIWPNFSLHACDSSKLQPVLFLYQHYKSSHLQSSCMLISCEP